MTANYLFSIVGPTGVGKTGFALWLAEQFPELKFDLISVDSRQVYRDLAIISGADLPAGFVEHHSSDPAQHVFAKDNCRIYGLLMLPYSAEWSVSHFRNFAQAVIKKSWAEGRLPILVGGTGLYHDHLFNPSEILDIEPNPELRAELSGLSLRDLQERLAKISPTRFEKLNNSDYFNPARLMRAIEIAAWEIEHEQREQNAESEKSLFKPDKHLIIGLKDNLENIKTKIAVRVAERFENGAKSEVSKLTVLLDQHGPNKQLLSATGVREMQAYLDGQVEKTELFEKWTLREFQYAKRQLTWWKNKPDVNWFEVGEPNWQSKAKKLVEKFILPTAK